METEQCEFTSQVIYPDFLSSVKDHSYIIGWNLDNFRCCITSVISTSYGSRLQIGQALQMASDSLKDHVHNCSRFGSVVPSILGEWIPNINTSTSFRNDMSQSSFPPTQSEGIWITLTNNESKPCIIENDNLINIKLHSIYSLGCLYRTQCYLIRYRQPDTDGLHCYESMLNEAWIGVPNFRTSFSGQSPAGCSSISTDPLSAVANSTTSATEVDFIVAQINIGQLLTTETLKSLSSKGASSIADLAGQEPLALRNVGRLGSVLALLLASLGAWLSLLSAMRRTIFKQFKVRTFSNFMSLWLGIRFGNANTFAGTIRSARLQVPGQEEEASASDGEAALSLCDISLTAAHFYLRLRAIDATVCKSLTFHLISRGDPQSRRRVWVEAMSFWLLLAVDVGLGVVFGYYIYSRSMLIVSVVSSICRRVETVLILDSLQLFSQSPGGIKLSPLITKNLSAFVRNIMLKFRHMFELVSPQSYAGMVKLLACAGSLGLSTQIDVAIDIIRILSFHVALVHRLSAIQHSFQLHTMKSLWLLFQGQKLNVLRNRIDSCEYDRQRLLFGTIAFAIMIFVYPSCAVYFFLFAFLQLLVVFVQFLLWSIGVAVKEFPYYFIVAMIADINIASDNLQFHLIPLSVRGHREDSASDNIFNDSVTISKILNKKKKKTVSFYEEPEFKINENEEKVVVESHDQSNDPNAISAEANASLIVSASREARRDRGEDSRSVDVSAGGSPHPSSVNKTGVLQWLLEENVRSGPQIHTRAGFTREVSADASRQLSLSLQPSPRRTFLSRISDRQSGSRSVTSPKSVQKLPPDRERIKAITAEQQFSTQMSVNSSALDIKGFSTVTHVGLDSASVGALNTFRSYYLFFQFLFATRGLIVKLLRSIIIGYPALDIILVQSSVTLFTVGHTGRYIWRPPLVQADGRQRLRSGPNQVPSTSHNEEHSSPEMVWSLAVAVADCSSEGASPPSILLSTGHFENYIFLVTLVVSLCFCILSISSVVAAILSVFQLPSTSMLVRTLVLASGTQPHNASHWLALFPPPTMLNQSHLPSR